MLTPGRSATTAVTEGRAMTGRGDAAEDLAAGLTGLAGLVVGRDALEETLTRVAEFAVQAIPGAEGAGLTMLDGRRAQTVVASADFVSAVDDIQYRLREGPCLSAVDERRVILSGNLGGERQWPRFGPRVGRLGVHSALSLPLILADREAGDRVLGALNVYARPRNAFDDRALQLGVAFSRPAAVSVANAQMLARAQRVIAELQEALASRAEIDQALGVVMSRTGATAEEAFARLRSMSQSRNVKLSEVARDLLAEATARARARHTGPG